jgi:acid stress-induced BolA-like protein IbaG/YrbA
VIAETVRARIAGAIAGSDVSARGDGSRMEVVVVADAFDGVGRVRRQQMVYGAIAELISAGELHAVTIRAMTPAERAGAE